MDGIEDVFRVVLGVGLESRDINVAQMALRAAVIYITTVVIVRLGKKRFMGQATAFDVILGIMLGSIVSRAITGNAPILPALGAAAVLVAMHSLFSALAVRWHRFGWAIKGEPRLLIENGKVDERAMRKAHMTDKDLWEDLRAKSVSRLEEVTEGRLERSGNLSVIKAKREPKVMDIRVADGVQTVRIELG